MKTTKAILTELGACSEAVTWAGRKTHKQAWETCKRGDWLLWIADRFDVDRKLLVLAACGCARTVLKYVPVGEDRPRIAIETAEAWTRGEAMIDQVRSAADAASAAHALYAAEAAAYAAAYAAADAAAHAADAADTSRISTLEKCADIVRDYYPVAPTQECLAESPLGKGERDGQNNSRCC